MTADDLAEKVAAVLCELLPDDDCPCYEAADALLPLIREREAAAWDEGRNAPAEYRGPIEGHYADCLGWEDCWCATYTNPYTGSEGA